MAFYSANSARQDHFSHTFLIGPPLVLISLFCFGYMMMKAHNPQQTRVSSKNNSAVAHQATQLPASKFAQQNDLTVDSSTDSITKSATSNSGAASPQSSTGQSTLQPSVPNKSNGAAGGIPAAPQSKNPNLPSTPQPPQALINALGQTVKDLFGS